MKKLSICMLMAVMAAATFSSCTKDDRPKIEDIEVTNHDDGTSKVKRGGTISVEFEAIANDDTRLDYYHIEIHDHPASGKIEDEYRIIDDSFKNVATFKGLKNAHVHQHVVVPANANKGSYHVVITVVDEAGNSADTEGGDAHIEVID